MKRLPCCADRRARQDSPYDFVPVTHYRVHGLFHVRVCLFGCVADFAVWFFRLVCYILFSSSRFELVALTGGD